MRIERVTLHPVRIPFRRAFAHAAHARSACEAILVSLQDQRGETGWGEIQPRPYVTGETLEQVETEVGPRLASEWQGRSITSFEEAHRFVLERLSAADRQLATFGGFEVALFDLLGKYLNQSAGTVLGPVRVPKLPAGVIIGFDTSTAELPRLCAKLRWRKARFIKVKVGAADDRARLTILAERLPEVAFRIDANGAWDEPTAVEQLRSFGDLPIASVEQPLAAEDLDGLARLRADTKIPIMVDESLVSHTDAETIVAAKAADVFNVRMGKHGGFVASQRIVDLALRHDLGVNLGTMVGETGILTRAAEIFANRVEGFACLDGRGQNHDLLEEDVVTPRGAPFQVEADAPGLGVTIAQDKLRTYEKQR